jgi:hypothetical protein
MSEAPIETSQDLTSFGASTDPIVFELDNRSMDLSIFAVTPCGGASFADGQFAQAKLTTVTISAPNAIRKIHFRPGTTT